MVVVIEVSNNNNKWIYQRDRLHFPFNNVAVSLGFSW